MSSVTIQSKPDDVASEERDPGRVYPRLRSVTLPQARAAASLWFILLCNAPFWGDAVAARGGLSLSNLPFLFSVGLFAFVLTNLVLTILTPRLLVKPILGFFFFVTPLVTYFMATVGVMFDSIMLRNTFGTDTREATELITPRMLAYMLLLAVPPLVWLVWARIERRPLPTELGRALLVVAGTLAAVGGIAAVWYQDYASLLRNHREIRYRLAPMNIVASLYKYSKEELRAPRVLHPLGTDARRAAVPPQARRSLVVVVVGETAREANFSLGGYARQTNPELAKRNVLFYDHVHSCSTSTARSLPCMFSNLGNAKFNESAAASRENLLDVVKRAGIEVLWRDNNSGCKRICERVETEILYNRTTPGLCNDGECFDEILLDGLQDRIDRATGDMLIVLHQKGSHGPGYHLRYPARFKVFVPACETTSLEKCKAAEVVNAYDNTILYTDYVLAQTIDLLDRNSEKLDSAMIYVSDHGESLGENGVYLHGIPSVFAPDTQTHVPMIVWLSHGFEQREALDRAVLESSKTRELSHDNLFHSVLGLLNVETTVYRSELDLFHEARLPAEAHVPAVDGSQAVQLRGR